MLAAGIALPLAPAAHGQEQGGADAVLETAPALIDEGVSVLTAAYADGGATIDLGHGPTTTTAPKDVQSRYGVEDVVVSVPRPKQGTDPADA